MSKIYIINFNDSVTLNNVSIILDVSFFETYVTVSVEEDNITGYTYQLQVNNNNNNDTLEGFTLIGSAINQNGSVYLYIKKVVE